MHSYHYSHGSNELEQESGVNEAGGNNGRGGSSRNIKNGSLGTSVGSINVNMCGAKKANGGSTLTNNHNQNAYRYAYNYNNNNSICNENIPKSDHL